VKNPEFAGMATIAQRLFVLNGCRTGRAAALRACAARAISFGN